MTAALRILAYGDPSDKVDDPYRMAESTARESMYHFCDAVIEKFGAEFLRQPTNHDIEMLLAENAARGMPGMIGSIDCMHWFWDMCPMAFQGQFAGKGAKPSVVLEAIASYDLWTWHCYFGTPGSQNDINIIDSSPVTQNYINGTPSNYRFHLGSDSYDPYYLADGIYPDYPIFVKTVHEPATEKERYFAKKQEALRKDVERAFGVLQKRFFIIRSHSRVWSVSRMRRIMKCCIILHNMIIQDERNLSEKDYDCISRKKAVATDERQTETLESFIERFTNVKNPISSAKLQQAIIDHVWTLRGNQ